MQHHSKKTHQAKHVRKTKKTVKKQLSPDADLIKYDTSPIIPNTQYQPLTKPAKRVRKITKSKDKKYKHLSNNKNIIREPAPMYAYYANLGKDDATLNKKQDGLCRCMNYTVKDIDTPLKSLDSNIELKKCNNPVKPGTDFCPDHQDCPKFVSKSLSGSEVEYNPKAWKDPYIEGSHNCYAYFLDNRKDSIRIKCKEICLTNNKQNANCPKDNSECQTLIPQPGDYYLMNKYGNLKKKERVYTCPNMNEKILSDNPEIKPVKLMDKCPANHYKGAMVVDRGNTFHFYRQNPDASWSHKPGILPVTNIDASGKKIYVPHFADRNYSNVPRENPIKYNDFCGYYCIPRNNFTATNLA